MKGRSHPARRIAHGALAALLAFGLTPTAAFAEEQSVDGESAHNEAGVIEQLATQQQERWNAALATGNLRILTDESIYSAEDDGALLAAREALPSSYDLRDKGVVTPVKRQNPWGTCWGFAAIAAAETSILSEMGTTYEEFPLDLSESLFASFARTALPLGSGSQA